MAWLTMFDLPGPTANNRLLNTGARHRASLARRAKYASSATPGSRTPSPRSASYRFRRRPASACSSYPRVREGQRAHRRARARGRPKARARRLCARRLGQRRQPEVLSASNYERKAARARRVALRSHAGYRRMCRHPGYLGSRRRDHRYRRTPTSHLVIGLIELAHVNALGSPTSSTSRIHVTARMARLIRDEIDRRIPARIT